MTPFAVVNRFFFFSMNYKVGFYNWEDMWGEMHEDFLPMFIMEVDWGCSRQHMIEKWKYYGENEDSYGRINRFYAELDNENREAFVNWMMNNYHE